MTALLRNCVGMVLLLDLSQQGGLDVSSGAGARRKLKSLIVIA